MVLMQRRKQTWNILEHAFSAWSSARSTITKMSYCPYRLTSWSASELWSATKKYFNHHTSTSISDCWSATLVKYNTKKTAPYNPCHRCDKSHKCSQTVFISRGSLFESIISCFGMCLVFFILPGFTQLWVWLPCYYMATSRDVRSIRA